MAKNAVQLFSRPARLAHRYAVSKAMLDERTEALRRTRGEALRIARSIPLPVHVVPAHQVLARYVPHDASYLPDYPSLLRCPPDSGMPGRETGALSTANRYTGAIDVGQPGLNGLYCGTADGVAAEDNYYKVWKDYDDQGCRRLMPTTGRVVVQRIRDSLNRWDGQDVPEQLIISGSTNANIVILRTIRPVRSFNLNLRDPAVRQHLRAYEPKFRDLLKLLKFESLEDAIEDPLFRDFARQFVFGACEGSGVEAIWASSARIDEAGGLPGFDAGRAQNLVLLGEANQSVSDRVVGVAVISLRSDPANGIEVIARSLHAPDSPYPPLDRSGLIVRPSFSSLD